MLRPQEVQKNLQIYLHCFLVQSKTVRLPVVNTAEPWGQKDQIKSQRIFWFESFHPIKKKKSYFRKCLILTWDHFPQMRN